MSTSASISGNIPTGSISSEKGSSGGSHSMKVVSEQIYEFLLTEMSLYAAKSCTAAVASSPNNNNKNNKQNSSNSSTNASMISTNDPNSGDNNDNVTTAGGGGASTASGATTVVSGGGTTTYDDEESMTVAAEMAAAKLERMGYAVGYRITERLAQNKTWTSSSVPATTPQTPPAGNTDRSPTAGGGDTQQQQQQFMATATAAQQLEAVKFLCKEVWMEIFRKQIDKLQTNHRGVFVLKDLQLKWLIRYPVGTEVARVSAIRLLAFPCGIIRGALSNLGIPAVVSCDFLADGQRMAACSFNIKVK